MTAEIPTFGCLVRSEDVSKWSLGVASCFDLGLVGRLGCYAPVPPLEELATGQLLLCKISSTGAYPLLQTTSGQTFPHFGFEQVDQRLALVAVGSREAALEHSGSEPYRLSLEERGNAALVLLSRAGLVGVETFRAEGFGEPNVVKPIASFVRDGKTVTTRELVRKPSLNPSVSDSQTLTVLFVADGMGGGKTTAGLTFVAAIKEIEDFTQMGFAKVTGSANREGPARYLKAGVDISVDFSCFPAVPSTVNFAPGELAETCDMLRKALASQLGSGPVINIFEFGDSIWQRETGLCLEHIAANWLVDIVFFAGGTTQSALDGIRQLTSLGFREVVITGRVASDVKQQREVITLLGRPVTYFDSLGLMTSQAVESLLIAKLKAKAQVSEPLVVEDRGLAETTSL